MRYALRAVSSAMMLALMLAVLGVLAAVTVLAVTTLLAVAFRAGGNWASGAGIVVVGMLVAVGVGLFVRRRRRKRSAGVGVSIASDVQPMFWVEIYRVAEGLGTRSPDEVVLFPDASVSVSEQKTWLGRRQGVRRLHLGLPLLAGLTERELRAVIAHAFCRSWGHTSLARVILRGQKIIGWVADRVGEDSRVGRIVERYGRTYVAVSSPITCRYELAVDRLCADFAGNSATASALSEVAVLSKGWAAFVDGYTDLAAAVGRRPDDLFAGFEDFLQEPGRRQQLAEPAGGSASERPWAYDSQLSIGDRLAAIASLPADGIEDKSRPALGLIRYPDQIIRHVEESMFGGLEFVPATWAEIVPEAARTVACDDALQLARLAHEGGLGQTLSVATLLELMSFGLVDEMVRPMRSGDPCPEVERQTAVRLVTGFLATAAIESGTASYRFSWAAPRQLVDEQGAVDDLPLLVDAVLADPSKVSALELWLTAHRVGQDLELGEGPEQAMPGGLPCAPADGQAEDPSGDPRQVLVSES